tara:strand:- start:1782 stop:2387 length:606 start_codon:yes stop_codon:yes gene_type:complete
MASTRLYPFRQYDENDVINLFAFNGTSCDAGRLAVLETSAGNVWSGIGADDDIVGLGSNTGATYSNVVSTQFTAKGKYALCGVGVDPIGMTLMATAETDENGEKLLYNPRKAAEMGVVIAGQVSPLVNRGIILYSSSETAWTGSTVTANTVLRGQANGILGTATGSSAVAVAVGLGEKAAVSAPAHSTGTWNAGLIKLELG